MKKAYKKPEVKLVDFSYDEQVTAMSVPSIDPPGWEWRPDNDYYCQYLNSWGSCYIFVTESICDYNENSPKPASLFFLN